MGRRLAYEFDDWRPGDQKVFVSDIRQAERELQWRPEVSAEQGVDRMVDWLTANAELFSATAGR